MSGDRPWPSLLALALGLLLWSPRATDVGRRARFLQPVVARAAPPPTPSVRRAWLLAGAAGAAAGLLVGGGTGLVAGAAVTVVGGRLLRRGPPAGEEATRTALLRELPGACDLLGVCLASGVPVTGALTAVGATVPAPLGPRLRDVAALYRLGAEPRQAWEHVPAELAALGRVLVRAGESGSAVVPALRSLAADSRTAARAQTDAAVRRAGVWVLAPLGACFLPAFLCLGVVPLVLGIASGVFG
jgi:Flp pilus assembly protein TadB